MLGEQCGVMWDPVSEQRLTFELSAIYILELNVTNFHLFSD